MILKYTISEYPALAENLVAKCYEIFGDGTADAEVQSIAVPAPHTAPVLIEFDNLDRIPHRVRLIGVTSGTIFHKYTQEPTEPVVTIFDPIHFKIGDGGALTPTVGDSTYINPSLIGLATSDFTIYRTGYGFMYPTLNYYFDSGVGTIQLNLPDIFNDEEEIWIFRQPKSITTTVNDSVVGKSFGGFVDVVSSVNYSPADLRKLIRLSGASAIYTYPAGASIPVGYGHRITNFGAYALITDKGRVRFLNAPLKWGNTTVTFLDVPFSATFEFTFDGTFWNVTQYSNNAQSTTPYGYISYKGSYHLGDVSATDTFVTVTIPNQGGTDYYVVGMLVGNGPDRNLENDVVATLSNQGKTATSFALNTRAYANQVEDLTFEFIVIKNS